MVCSCENSNMLTGLPRDKTSCTACSKKNHLRMLSNHAQYKAFSLIDRLSKIREQLDQGQDASDLVQLSKDLTEELAAIVKKM